MQKKSIVINDVLIKYYQSDDAQATSTLLFIHGWRSNSGVWLNLIESLSNKYNCLALDLPAFGESSTPKEAYDTDNYSEVVVEFIKKLNLKDVVGIGHSYGGRLLINLGIKYPNLFNKIVLVDSSGIDRDRNKANIFRFISKAAKPIFTLPLLKLLRPKIYDIIGAEDYIAADESIYFRKTYQNVIRDDFTEEVAKINIPTLIIWGNDDKATPVSMASILNSKIQDSELQIINDAGHYPFLDQPEIFRETLINFLNMN